MNLNHSEPAEVRVWRDPDGVVRMNLPHSVVWHSPDGFEVRYGGSGPADLALNILNAYVPPGPPMDWEAEERDDAPQQCYRGEASLFASRHHQDFKWALITSMQRSGGTIPGRVITDWIAARRPPSSTAATSGDEANVIPPERSRSGAVSEPQSE